MSHGTSNHSETDTGSHVSGLVHELLGKVEQLMATVQNINDQLVALSTDVDRCAVLFAEESAEGEGSGVASQAELDAIAASVTAIQAKVAALQSDTEPVPTT